MDKLDQLENDSIFILREAYHHFPRLCLLWSMGKDSTLLLWLVRKAFFGHVPMPLVHIDTGFEIPEALEFRDRIAQELHLRLFVGRNDTALQSRTTYVDSRNEYPDDASQQLSRKACCSLLRTEALKATLSGTGPRYLINPKTGVQEPCNDKEPWEGVIVGARADEEGSRSKERTFSPRNRESEWDVADQPPELWNQFATEFRPGTHVRIHPLLDWTELDVWCYLRRESVPLLPLYFNQGSGKRYRSLGCWPCQEPIASQAADIDAVITELSEGKLKSIGEREGRLQDREMNGGLEELRKEGYM